ncbi:hypothetical protein RN001_011294 [Aquatica leii]|uniref:Zinc finger CCHC-type and RNA-binding motif-containing protein 1 n=1 Tax=Aquatica leii TaxID=1421715 RepID=A0AAN7SNP0_9COLE|nr:hypothetical protein RN001_011294 [Aquatica leii]
MSHGLVPSKSTVYVSNLPYELKNNDLHKIFEKHGKIIKVTVVKDRQSRKSKGVAFILYLNRDDANKCVEATNLQEMFGRTLKASIAKDNGRSAEFIRRKNYPDKSACYECGETGHLSYKCEKNLLGERNPPPKKVRKRKKPVPVIQDDVVEDEDDYETLSAAIALEQEKYESISTVKEHTGTVKKKFKKSNYFSDEEESD